MTLQVEVEFELRQSSELGKPNKKTGHVQTYERHDMVRHEKKLMESLSRATKDKNVESGVKPEDLEKTKNAIAKMNRLLNEIREKQVNERHRLSIHKAVNEHSHSRMVVGSLLETVFYIAVSGFQVYTIRKWFSGNSLLGY
uniref:GOLD domain-containing protein n=1 Tax=Chaetoceros debilis TaxID=122233 RepID=A0A7S3VC34_9STRA